MYPHVLWLLLKFHDVGFKFQPQIAAIPTTKGALPLAKLWLDTCRKSHNSCWSSTTTTVPTRLIDLRGVDLKLIHGSDLEKSIEYATLSHCWGDASFATLRKDCISQYLTNIPEMGLPRTFNEAVHIARYLNFNYLWIDSLCIVQDDTDDWRRESARMASVYGNSSFNIAATGASNSSVGCFLEREPLWRMQRRAEFEKTEQLYECVSKSYQESLEDNPLVRRGWVLQERILAPRTLHLTRTELFWVCKEMQVSEIFPDEKWQPISNEKAYSLLRPPFGLKTWESLVTAYSHCKLTYARDKLVALSGLAQASRLGSWQEYFAGFWEKELDIQLCWKVSGGSKHPSYCAPSWSWASLNGEVSFEQSNQNTVHIKVQDVQVQPLQPEVPYGEVKSATLHLLCTGLFASNVTERPALWGDRPLAGHFYEIRAWCFDAKHEMDGREQYTDYSDCFLLPMIQYQVGETYEPWTGSTEFAPAFTGLRYLTFFLLLRSTGVLRGQYSRVGWMEIYSVDDSSWIEGPDITHGSQAQQNHYIEGSQRQWADGKEFTGVIELV